MGSWGKGPESLYAKYRKKGLEDVTLRLYDGDRHEIINETDRDVVYADLAGWLESRM